MQHYFGLEKSDFERLVARGDGIYLYICPTMKVPLNVYADIYFYLNTTRLLKDQVKQIDFFINYLLVVVLGT